MTNQSEAHVDMESLRFIQIIQSKDIYALGVLLAEKSNFISQPIANDLNFWTPLFYAVQAGWLGGVELIIAYGANPLKSKAIYNKGDLNKYNYTSILPIHIACAEGHNALITRFLNDDNYQIEDLIAGLNIAMANQKLETVHLLFALIMKSQPKELAARYNILLDEIIDNENLELLTLLLAHKQTLEEMTKSKIKINLTYNFSKLKRNQDLWLALLEQGLGLPQDFAVLSFNDIKLILSVKKEFIHAVDCHGLSLLMHAVKEKDYELFTYLMNEGANFAYVINKPEDKNHGKSVLDFALSRKQTNIAHELLKKGLRPKRNKAYFPATLEFLITLNPTFVVYRYTYKEITNLLHFVKNDLLYSNNSFLRLKNRVHKKTNQEEIAHDIESVIYESLNYIQKISTTLKFRESFFSISADQKRSDEEQITAAETLIFVICGHYPPEKLMTFNSFYQKEPLAALYNTFRKYEAQIPIAHSATKVEENKPTTVTMNEDLIENLYVSGFS